MPLGVAAALLVGFCLGMYLGDTGRVCWNVVVYLGGGVLVGTFVGVWVMFEKVCVYREQHRLLKEKFNDMSEMSESFK